MGKKVVITLNQKELKKMAKKLDNVANALEKAETKVVDDLAEVAFDKILNNYKRSKKEPTQSMVFFKRGTKNEKYIGMSGTQAIYSEFGTGTMGERSPHLKKQQFSLKPYNSGKTIRAMYHSEIDSEDEIDEDPEKAKIPQGELYWTYQDDNGKTHYTQGVAAQNIVYNASKSVRKKIHDICKKRIEEALKDL